jgi:thiamine biosynthesis protein ThiI
MRKRFICLLSGGIDSIVAAWFASRYGDIVFVHIDNEHFLPRGTRERVLELAKVLSALLKKKLKLYFVKNGQNIKTIIANAPRKSTCVLCRRTMYRIAEEIARREHAYGIVTGESLAQVASQTLYNLVAESYDISVPILRPLFGLDKEEIVVYAKQIGTYNISCTREKGCYGSRGRFVCCFATPKYPETHASVEFVKSVEKELNIDIKGAVDSAEVLIVGE